LEESNPEDEEDKEETMKPSLIIKETFEEGENIPIIDRDAMQWAQVRSSHRRKFSSNKMIEKHINFD
jgi:hypothetical protein